MLAFEWEMAAAKQGYNLAEDYVAYALQHGIGTKKDSAAAIRWYLPRADRGDVSAQLALGLIYATAQGVTDLVQSYKWYSLALASTKVDSRLVGTATMFRDNSLALMTAEQRARAETLVRDWKPVAR